MPTYHDLNNSDLIENWDTSDVTANDTWPVDASIIGYLGDISSASTTNVDPRTLTSAALGAVDVVANQSSAAVANGGVIDLTIGSNTMMALQGSGTADAPSLVFYLNASGRQDVTLAFDAIDIDSTADDAAQQINIQYRTSPTGEWINVPGGYFSDVSVLGTQTTPISVTLPAGADNAATLEVRVMTTNAGGNDELIGIDNIVIGSEPLEVDPTNPGTLSIADAAAVSEGDDGFTQVSFTVTRAEGGDGAVSADWTILHGTTNSADFSGPTSGTVSFAEGENSRTITLQVAGDLLVEPTESFTVQLSNAQGGVTITDASGSGSITSDDLPPIANVWINEFHYDTASSDRGEFIEVAGQADTDLSGYTIVLYNGGNGGTYGPVDGIPLTGTIADAGDGFGFASVLAPGLQNGSPDGFALVDSYGRVVQFLSYEGSFTATSGPAAGMTSTDIGRFEDGAPAGTSLQLSGTGSTYADFTWTFGEANTSGVSNFGQSFLSGTDPGQIRIDNAQVVEGDSGEAQLVFTLHRSGGFATDATVEYTLGFVTAEPTDLAAGTPLSGSVTFAAGEFTQTISIPVSGDVMPEFNEWLFVQLTGVTGNAAIVDTQGVGTIVNDDLLPLRIYEIQGATHWSEFEGQPVSTQGIVTAIAGNGFYLQDLEGDGDARTSDGIFVFTGSAPAVAVGDAVMVTGRVTEFGSDLPVTEINATGEARFGVAVVGHTDDLPDAIAVGSGRLLPTTESIDSDGLTVFNPETDGADFWESLEGMLVEIDRPQVVADSNGFGETNVVASLGEGATGMNASGGITISPGDYNPEMIQIDGELLGAGYTAGHSTGDQLATVIGVINYSFAHYELLLTEVPEGTVDVTLQPEVADFTGDANYMTVATLNVHNLDPSDGLYDDIAEDIVTNLRLPDVIAVQEMQDNDGTGRGADLSADQNAQNLIDAIYAISGVTYAYAEIAPDAPNTTGGEANGNIRNGYLYRVDRVDLVDGSLEVIEDPSYSNSRLPLIATWEFQGQEITTINVHFYARSGSDPLWGADQPPSISGEDRREDQAAAVGNWINENLATDPSLNIAVLGDWNGFYFEEAQTQLGLVNLQAHLLPESERYSYLFDGNAQLLDNIAVTGGLLPGAGVDGVHINAYFGAAGTSDHDPQVARFLLGTRPSDITLEDASVTEGQPAGTVVGTVTAVDAPGDVLQFSLVDDSDGRFAINAATGVITTLVPIDHDALPQTSIIVRVTDAAGQSTDQSFLVSIGVVLEGGRGADAMVATAGDDQLSGGSGNDRADGGAGHDLLDGGRGGDVLIGGAGDDLLIGGRGDDALTGGAGRDIFVFGASAGNDLILDFNLVDDQLRLEDGQVIVGSIATDLDGDGVTDLLIELEQGAVGLLGVSSIEDVDVNMAAGTGANQGPGLASAFNLRFSSIGDDGLKVTDLHFI